MPNLIEIWTKALHFFKVGLWQLDKNDTSGIKAFLLRPFRVAVLTVQGFMEDKCALQASALTFYSLLAVVPVVALLFGFAQGFGLDQYMEKGLYQRFAGQEEVITRIIEFSRNLLKNTRGGLIAGISLVVLFWSAIRVLGRIETTMNQIWKVTSRSAIRKFTDYLAIIIIGPFLVVISSSINVYITAHLTAIVREVVPLRMASPLLVFLLKMLPYGLIWILFILIYLVIPNTRVKLISALVGGLVAGAVFQFVQGGYIYAQLFLSKNNAIYGSFAALPLFLIWIQLSWMIVLFGAQIAYADQHVGRHVMAIDYKGMSANLQKKYALYVIWALVQQFRSGNGAMNFSDIAEQLDLPTSLVAHSIEKLIQSGLVSPVINGTTDIIGYQPALDISNVTVSDVFQALDKTGMNDLPSNSAPNFKRIFNTVEEVARETHELSANRLVKDL